MKGNVFKGQECGWYKKVVLVLQKPFHTWVRSHGLNSLFHDLIAMTLKKPLVPTCAHLPCIDLYNSPYYSTSFWAIYTSFSFLDSRYFKKAFLTFHLCIS
jgi:hypothetical protein